MRWVEFLAGYVEWKAGKRATPEEAGKRLGACAACEHRVGREVDDDRALRVAAGLFGKDAPVVLTCGICGCIVGSQAPPGSASITINGLGFEPAAKAECASATCPHPQEPKW